MPPESPWDQDEANWLRTCWKAATTNLAVIAKS